MTALRGGPWTGREEMDVVKWFKAGMHPREIAVATERSLKSVAGKLSAAGLLRPRKHTIQHGPGVLDLAKKALAKEVAKAKEEAGSAKPFKPPGPLEW